MSNLFQRQLTADPQFNQQTHSYYQSNSHNTPSKNLNPSYSSHNLMKSGSCAVLNTSNILSPQQFNTYNTVHTINSQILQNPYASSLSPLALKNINPYSPSAVSFPSQAKKQSSIPHEFESSVTFNSQPHQRFGSKACNGISKPIRTAYTLNQNEQENLQPTNLFTQEFSNQKSNLKPTLEVAQDQHIPRKNIFLEADSLLTPPDFFERVLNSPSPRILKEINFQVNTRQESNKCPPSSQTTFTQQNGFGKYINTTPRLETLSARDDLSEISTYSDRLQSQTFSALASQNNKKVVDPLNRPLTGLLENAINKAMINSERLILATPTSARKNSTQEAASPFRTQKSNQFQASQVIMKNTPEKQPQRVNNAASHVHTQRSQTKSMPQTQNNCSLKSSQCITERVKNCMTPHKRTIQSYQTSMTPPQKVVPCCQGNCKNQSNCSYNDFNSTSKVKKTPSKVPISALMEQIISNIDVQQFLKRHFLVGERLICDDWSSIPVIYFVKLLITEFPEVLEDHQIGENLLAELKETIGSLVVEDNDGLNECLSLHKLQIFTKTSGLLGLILHALKELSQEERIVTHTSIISNQGNRSVVPSNCPSMQASQLFDNVAQNFQKGSDPEVFTFQANDLLNIKNIIQEFVESLYREMENEIYSKFNIEMRRLTLKFTETEQLLRIANDKVTQNYEIFHKESTLQKNLKAIQEDNRILNQTLNQKDLEIQKLILATQSLCTENQRLQMESQQLHENLSRYMEFGMQNLQTLYENNLQDKYQLLVAQQKAFFEQLDQERKYQKEEQINIAEQRRKEEIEQMISKNLEKGRECVVNTEISETESCNAGACTLQDEEEDNTLTTSVRTRDFAARQKESAFRKNKTEGQTLEGFRNSQEIQLLENSDKLSLLRVLDVFICHSLRQVHKNTTNTRRIGAAERISAIFQPNYATSGIHRSTQQSDNSEFATEKLSSLIEILPLIRDVRLVSFKQLHNFMLYFYLLQLSMHQQQSTNNSPKDFKITEVPLNKSWKKILKELNQQTLYTHTQNDNSINNLYQSAPIQKTACLTPKSKMNISQMQMDSLHQLPASISLPQQKQKDGNEQSNQLIISNQAVIDILLMLFRQHIDRVDSLLEKIQVQQKQSQPSGSNQICNEKQTKLILLKALLQLNMMMISNNKNDIQQVLQRFIIDITSQLENPAVSEFIRDYEIIDVLFLSLKTINFANTKIIAEVLQFLITFKTPSQNYMAFVRQVSQDKNIAVLLKLLEQQMDPSNVALALSILKNLSYSFNFKDVTQNAIREVTAQILLRYSSNKHIRELAEAVKANVSCTVSIRTMPLSTNVSANFVQSQNLP